MKEFRIEFDSPTSAYYAGQIVSGRVILNLQDKPKKVRAVTIQFKGESKVEFSGQETVRKDNGDTANENVQFKSTEEYYDFKYNLLGGSQAEMEIPQGSHVYPFTSTLPPSLPSSFDGEHGYVRYKVTATLDRPWKFDEHAEGVFYVVTLYDLNTDMKAKETIHQEVSKNFCCLWCQSGPLQLILAAPFSGFVPGQTVPLSIDVENGSNVAVDKVTVELTKYMTWKATEPTSSEKQDKLDLVTEELGGVVVNSSKHWNHQLVVPVFPYVNLTNCHIIQQEFKLSVTAKVSGPHKDLVIKVPIVLGSVPIAEHSSVQSSLPAPTQPLAPQQNQMQNQAPPPPIGLNVNNLYPSIPAIDASPVSPTY
uniref:Arrestin domain-containing protein 3 n=1 Tax=Cacopsylla melanoneura TaxID=428564 RepID=A0A8D9BAL5_9HEMI